MHADILVHSAAQLLCLTPKPQRGRSLGALEVIEDGSVALGGEGIVEVGPTSALRPRFEAEREIDAHNLVVMPGFVDPHTHAMWMGDRTAEFEQRIAGATYSEILTAGGGILSTVRHTRSATVEALIEATLPRLRRMLAHGTTTCEIKTGYGLETRAELRMLEAITILRQRLPLTILATFLPAHAIPEEHAGDPQSYVDQLLSETLPEGMRLWRRLAGEREPLFVDVFCERGAFNLDQTRQLLERAHDLGYQLKVHADEFESLGGARLAAELGAVSADHLVATPEEDIQALGRSKTVAVSLPGTPFGLGQTHFTPARQFLEANAILAIASDFNPGTSPSESMQMALAIACRYMKLTPAQAIAASTINAAAALGLQHRLGSLTSGKQADLIALAIPSYRHLGYRYGTNLVEWVIQRGRVVYSA